MRAAITRHGIVLLAVLAALTSASCSLTSITDFELPSCTNDSDCEEVNVALRDLGEIPPGCHPWVCEQGRCVDLRQLSMDEDGDQDLERCDGRDNDCDQLVDEAYSESGAQVSPLQPTGERVIRGVMSRPEGISYAVDEQGDAAAAWTDEPSSPGNRPTEARFARYGSETFTELAYETNAVEGNLRMLDLESGCRQISGAGEVTTSCNFAEVAFDLVDQLGLAATVTKTGCRAGQLRLGFLDAEDPSIVTRGPGRRSNVYLGVDPTANGKCTGASRPECAEAIALLAAPSGPRCTATSECGGDPDLVQCLGRCRDATTTCENDDACSGGLVCGEAKFCTDTDAPCESDGDCATGTCSAYCVAPDDDPACATADDCSGALVCDRLCRSTDQVNDRIQDVCGVSQVATKALVPMGRKPQALVAWVADAFSIQEGDAVRRGECGGDEASVDVIGVYLEEGLFSVEFNWVTASNEGVPQSLGTTTGGGRPGVETVGSDGYLVGFRDGGSSDVALHFVPQAPEIQDYDGTSCCGDASGCSGTPPVACTGPDDRNGLETQPLATPVSLGPFGAAGGGPADDVAVAASPEANERYEVGIVWREGCGTPEDRIAFRRIRLRVTESGAEVEEMGDAVALTDGSLRVGPPAITYVPSGIVTEGFEPPGADAPAGPDETGGWWIAWTEKRSPSEPGRVVAKRVAEVGGAVVDEGAGIDLTQELGMVPDANAPSLSLDAEGAPRFSYHDGRNQAVVSGSLTCPERTGTGGEE